MRDSFPFLTRLGLRPDADAKDIRRAYARELKKIDQVADPAGFQELREAYEVALSWHAYQQNMQRQAEDEAEVPAEQAPLQVAAPAQEEEPNLLSRPAEAMPPQQDPRELAELAFQQFMASVAAQEQHSESRRAKLYKTALQCSLDSDHLLNLTARIFFEARIVGMFAAGANPGREALFAVANEAFDWERDRRRIQQFGEAGAMVSRAVDELKLFQSMTPYEIGTYKQLLRIVHAKPDPEGVVNRSDLLLFHQILSRFHTWFAVTIDRATLKNWIDAAQAESQRAPGDPRPGEQVTPVTVSQSTWERPAGSLPIAGILLAVVIAIFNMVGNANKPKGFYPPADRYKSQETQTQNDRSSRQAIPKAPDRPPSKEQLDEIRSRIYYVWPRDTAPGEYIVEYDVFLDAKGAVLGLNKNQSSGNVAYDQAVETAIRQTRPFPPGTKTMFRLRYSMTFSKPEAPKGNPPSREQLAAVQEKIFYVPSAGVEPGEVRVEFEVEIDNKGKVIKLKKLKASRDPAYDDAVADAIREAGIFTSENRRKFSIGYSRTWRR